MGAFEDLGVGDHSMGALEVLGDHLMGALEVGDHSMGALVNLSGIITAGHHFCPSSIWRGKQVSRAR